MIDLRKNTTTRLRSETLKTLRDGHSLRMWDRINKRIHQFQLNKKEERICWERWVKIPGGNWVNWNKYLSLKDIANILAKEFVQKSLH